MRERAGSTATEKAALVATGVCVLLILTGVTLLVLALLHGYRSAESQTVLSWSAALCVSGSIGAVAVALWTLRRRSGVTRVHEPGR